MTVAESDACEITIARVCPGEPEVARDESDAVARRRRDSMASGSRSPPASRVSPRTRGPSSGAPPPGVSTCHSFEAIPSTVRTTGGPDDVALGGQQPGRVGEQAQPVAVVDVDAVRRHRGA